MFPTAADVVLSGLISLNGQALAFDFGAGGIGGNRNSTAGIGYYALELDLDNNGSFETVRNFYRLLDG